MSSAAMYHFQRRLPLAAHFVPMYVAAFSQRLCSAASRRLADHFCWTVH